MIQLPPPDDSRSIDLNNVLETLRKTKAGMQRVQERLSEPLAIIGIGCRFPDAANPDEYWDLLHQGRSVDTVSGERWGESLRAEHEKQPGRITANRTGWLDAIDQFDPGFFGITGREAASLDPQQRLLLEIAWETFENAGIVPAKSRGQRIGAFVGICSNDYLYRLNRRGFDSIDTYLSTGNAHGAAAGRLSYVMDWRGPSVAVDTACSSSLTALHLATRSLRYGDCDVAIAMGVNVILAPELSISFSQAGMLSSSGRCHTFSSNADGFVRGEGCGAVLLKRLRDAVRDGDTIHCVVRGTAVNQDGRSVGLTAPNGNAQQAVIREAIKDASLEPEQVDYIEAHGTGTPLGDPIEVDALRQVFAGTRRPDRPLKIGSVKTNVGHLEGAAGIAGVLKVVLSLKHGTLPAHLHCEHLSPSIDWQWPVEVTTDGQRWATPMRIAGVSSFGFGGSNAHVILSDAPVPSTLSPRGKHPDILSGEVIAHHADTSPESLFVLSAKSSKALREYAQRFADKFGRVPERLVDICYSAATTREVFEHRIAFVVESTTDLVIKLNAFANGQSSMPEITMPTSRESIISATSPALSALADSFMRGESIDWTSMFDGSARRVELPTYPFQRTRRWMDDSPVKLPASIQQEIKTDETFCGIPVDHPMLGQRLDTASEESIFETDLNRLEYLDDHVVRGNILFPAAGMIELTLAVMASLGETRCTIESMRLHRPIIMKKNQPCPIQIVVSPVDEAQPSLRRIGIAMRDGARWIKVAQADVITSTATTATTPPILDGHAGRTIHAGEHYALMREHGLQYGPAFAGMRYRKRSENGDICVGETCLPDVITGSGYRFHPAWLDACFQVAASVIPDVERTWVPVGFETIELCREPIDDETLTVIAIRNHLVDEECNRNDDVSIRLVIQDQKNQTIARIEAMRLNPIQIRYSDTSARHADIDDARDDPKSLRDFLHHRIASIMGLELNEVPLQRTLDALGLDSLMAFELKDEMQSQFQIDIPLEMFFEPITLETFLDRVSRQIAEAGPRAAQSDDWVEGAL